MLKSRGSTLLQLLDVSRDYGILWLGMPWFGPVDALRATGPGARLNFRWDA